MQNSSISIDGIQLDPVCKGILRKLARGGWDKANTNYIVSDSQIAEHELSYLLKNGAVFAGSIPRAILGSYAVGSGADAGKISFRLNFDLA